MKKRYCITASSFDKRGRLIYGCTNSYENSSSLMRYYAMKSGNTEKKFNHAEIRCLEVSILKMRKKVARIVVVRYDSFGNYMSAEPCNICKMALEDFCIDEVLYSTREGMKRL